MQRISKTLALTPAARRIAVHALLCLTAFALASHGLARHAGDPELGGLTDKLRYFTANKDRYDLVFVGSSRVKRGIIPAGFDAQLAARGLPVRSFNLGVAGMKPHLARAVIRRLLASEPARLRWLVVELGEWDPHLRAANRFKRRTIFWHDGAETHSVLRSTLQAELPLVAKADLFATHALHFAARATGAGRGRDLVRRLLVDAPESVDMPGQGFMPFSQRSLASPTTHPMRRRFLRELPGYRQAVELLSAAASATDSHGETHGRYNLAALQAQTAMIRRAGIEPLSLITPIPRATPELDRLGEMGLIPHLLAFNDPAAYPELYAEEHRFDHEHLKEPGARAFTDHLARRFVAAVGAGSAVAGGD